MTTQLAFVKYYKDEIRWKELRPSELKLLFWLAQSISFEGVVVTQYQIVGDNIGTSRRFAISCVKRLKEKGIIDTQPQAGSHIAIWLKKGFSHKSLEKKRELPHGWQIPLFEKNLNETESSSQAGDSDIRP